VTPVNDAPTATALTLTAIVEDGALAANVGDTVASLTTTNSDLDTGAAKGMAITAAPSSDGQWQYTSNGGTSWTTITNVSTSAALLLPGSNTNYKVRFVPVNNFAGTVALTYQCLGRNKWHCGEHRQHHYKWRQYRILEQHGECDD